MDYVRLRCISSAPVFCSIPLLSSNRASEGTQRRSIDGVLASCLSRWLTCHLSTGRVTLVPRPLTRSLSASCYSRFLSCSYIREQVPRDALYERPLFTANVHTSRSACTASPDSGRLTSCRTAQPPSPCCALQFAKLLIHSCPCASSALLNFRNTLFLPSDARITEGV